MTKDEEEPLSEEMQELRRKCNARAREEWDAMKALTLEDCGIFGYVDEIEPMFWSQEDRDEYIREWEATKRPEWEEKQRQAWERIDREAEEKAASKPPPRRLGFAAFFASLQLDENKKNEDGQ